MPAAFVELVSDAPKLDLAELRQWAGQRMAPFKVPRRLRLMAPGEWPRTPSAKIARFMLPAMLD